MPSSSTCTTPFAYMPSVSWDLQRPNRRARLRTSSVVPATASAGRSIPVRKDRALQFMEVYSEVLLFLTVSTLVNWIMWQSMISCMVSYEVTSVIPSRLGGSSQRVILGSSLLCLLTRGYTVSYHHHKWYIQCREMAILMLARRIPSYSSRINTG